MPEWVSQYDVLTALVRLGYGVYMHEDDILTFRPHEQSQRILTLDFSQGGISGDDLLEIFEWEGVPIEPFVAELGSFLI